MLIYLPAASIKLYIFSVLQIEDNDTYAYFMEYISKIAYLTADRISDLNNITSDFILEGWDMLDLVKEVQTSQQK